LKQLWAIVGVLLVSHVCDAIVIRDDIPDSEYRVHSANYPMLACLPGEGHGVLISEQWIVTAAHAAVWRPIHEVALNGVSRRVAKVIVHPGYKRDPRKLQSGDAAPLMKFMSASDDIALIKLERTANDVTPVKLYRGADEPGKMAEIVGRGATGNGRVGEYPDSPHRGELRRAHSHIVSTDERWLALRFEAPPQGVALGGCPRMATAGLRFLSRLKAAESL
jgi:hypothetical protein